MVDESNARNIATHSLLVAAEFFLRVPVAVVWGKSPVPASAIGRVHCKVAMSAQLSLFIIWVLVEPRKSEGVRGLCGPEIVSGTPVEHKSGS